VFFIEGALLVFGLAALLSREKLWRRAVVVAVSLASFILFLSSNHVLFRSGSEWWQSSRWRNLVLFVLMLAGMTFRVLWDALDDYRARRASAAGQNTTGLLRPKFDRWDFLYPALVSLIVFQSVLWVAKSQDLSWELSMTSFQNGFFWNALLNRSRANIERQ